VVKWVARGVRRVDLFITRRVLALKGEPRYRLTGTCNGCGRCCEHPTVALGRVAWHLKSLRRLHVWWHRVVNGFELEEEDARFKLLTFRCTHYDASTKQCDSYGSRPLMCRDYPVNLTFNAAPSFFEECSHGVVLKHADRFRAALAQVDLPADQREALEKKLNLKE